MSSLNRNIVANFASTAWASILSLALLPVYVRLMGIESWGLVGLVTTLQALFIPLDLGLSTTLNRELAVVSSDPARRRGAIDTVRTIEIIYWGASVVFCGAVAAAAPFLAGRWVRPATLSVSTVTQAFLLIALLLMFQLPSSLYSGGLLGLQEQVKLNVVNVIFATVRAVGSVAALYFIAPTILVFLTAQALATACHTVAAGILLWRSLSGSSGARFRMAEFHRLRNFTAAMMGVSMLSVLLMQLDKIILSKMLSLAEFGYYTLAASVAAVMYRGVTPVHQALFPRLAELVSRGDTDTVRRVYHEASQLVSVMVLPAAIVLALFSSEALLLWLRDPAAAANTSAILSILVLGTALNSIVIIPNGLQVAYGWTRLPMYTNIVAVAFLAPAMVIAARLYGGVGAASVWLLLNFLYLFIGVQIMHRRILPGEQRSWYLHDLGRPLMMAALAAVLGKVVFTAGIQAPAPVALGITAIGTLAAAAFSVPVTVRWMKSVPQRLRRV